MILMNIYVISKDKLGEAGAKEMIAEIGRVAMEDERIAEFEKERCCWKVRAKWQREKVWKTSRSWSSSRTDTCRDLQKHVSKWQKPEWKEKKLRGKRQKPQGKKRWK